MQLTSGVQFTHHDKLDWIKGVRFLLNAMEKSGEEVVLLSKSSLVAKQRLLPWQGAAV